MRSEHHPARNPLSRRRLLGRAAAALPAAFLAPPAILAGREAGREGAHAPKGRVKQSVCKWCYKMPLEELARHAARIGYRGIDLVGKDDWPVVKKHGLVPTMAPGAGSIGRAWNRKEDHDRLAREMEENIALAAGAGVPNVITFSGNRRGLADGEGIENCVAGLKRVVGTAEEKKVTICMELLNSKVDHPDYQCDHTAWGVEVVKRVGSPRLKLLYDIYHMQIMEGDTIRTIRENIQFIGHFHTGGNPGRHEIDETQELYYPAIMRAIADLGFQGYVAQEFVPARDPVASMEQAFRICDV